MVKIHNQIKIIGITGNSGSGKSTVSEILKLYGGYLIKSDEIAHRIILPGNNAYNKLIETFGLEILKDDSLEINRKKLSSIVFNDRKKLELLNSITHPYIIHEIINQIKLLYFSKEKFKYIIIDAPLLIETKLNTMADEVWLINADEQTKIKRLTQRDKVAEIEIMKRFDNQMPFEKAKIFADKIIINDGTREELEDKIKKALDRD